jgi:hypothetical protein
VWVHIRVLIRMRGICSAYERASKQMAVRFLGGFWLAPCVECATPERVFRVGQVRMAVCRLVEQNFILFIRLYGSVKIYLPRFHLLQYQSPNIGKGYKQS